MWWFMLSKDKFTWFVSYLFSLLFNWSLYLYVDLLFEDNCMPNFYYNLNELFIVFVVIYVASSSNEMWLMEFVV